MTWVLILAPGTLAAALTNAGCADPKGFDTCQAQANNQVSSCIAQAKKDGSQQEILACGCQDYTNSYNCYSAFCWNRVWECEYQDYIIGHFQNCPTAKLPVPYFPAPHNAPDACSCNIGKVYLATQNAIQETAQYSNNANGIGDSGNALQVMQGCSCCEISGAISSMWVICPDTDPMLIGLAGVSQLESQINAQFDQCGQYLETYDCETALGYELDGLSTYYRPDNLPQSGTATLSNGPGTVTAPASSSVFTYTNGADGTIYTITAANVKSAGGSGSNSQMTGSGSRQTAGTGS
ncbi:hypothetical protein B0I35DRAFT_485371 [Stachybotrys elegans]|uniref:Uncharacterized protein n=1 Tax=Stachybotrys elegans TaxID=80388 RepID=A0A8K0SG66_9HYPO|nr:hypothetical protein B0I35DRAFT_485371 [Stachybotrys elegans]